MVNGEFPAFETMLKNPVNGPEVFGEKDAWKVTLWLVVKVRGTEIPLIENPVPVRLA